MEQLINEQQKPVEEGLPKSAEELEALTEAQKLALATKSEFYACQGKFTTSSEKTTPYTIVREFRNDSVNETDTEKELCDRGHMGLNEESVLVSSLVTGSGKSAEAFRIWTIAPAKQPGYVQINYSFPIDRAYDGVAKREARATYTVIVPEVLGEIFSANSSRTLILPKIIWRRWMRILLPWIGRPLMLSLHVICGTRITSPS